MSRRHHAGIALALVGAACSAPPPATVAHDARADHTLAIALEPDVATYADVTTTTSTTTTEAPQAATPTTAARRPPVTTVDPSDMPAPQSRTTRGACGGSLPPCAVMERESGGNLTVYNTEGSGASGKWQALGSTWNGYGGYANAADAPESVQDDFARQLWDNGRGCSHWAAC